MSSSRNLNIVHRTRFKNGKGRIIGKAEDIHDDNTFVHWCPTKKVWVTDKSMLHKQFKELNVDTEYTTIIPKSL